MLVSSHNPVGAAVDPVWEACDTVLSLNYDRAETCPGVASAAPQPGRTGRQEAAISSLRRPGLGRETAHSGCWAL